MEVTPKLKSAYCPPCYAAESSPSEFKEEKQRLQLSASLRERLKRSRRSFISPVAKRLCVDNEEEEEEGGQQVSAATAKPEPVPEPAHVTSEDFAEQLRKEIKAKTETLRRLKMVQMYRSKNDLNQLQILINKWRSCAQAALYELQSGVSIDGRKANLSELMDLFGLGDSILHFDRCEDDFTPHR
ncbi:swi5-dependent recombination DNA repair protein 1 homolog [Austrofundulus limnaeus]|uniref:Swi5-dependent recombination DNA repair protein 1 homolog n=1 Tax=Austrofundulus limnaeus TaxID=52670 RepID=A0A2I4AQI9_AUSLI|nr:PREDICTED: swi5-dependent recombination DNA repair protein 1 homolog [Austrofundulus limnaeus]